CPAGVTGWRGEYYANQTLSGGATVCRDDAVINFNWGSGTPAAGIGSDHFSVRWTRTENFAAGTYVFTMGSDDGGRLRVDGTLVLDQWFDQGYPGVPPSISLNIAAGTHTIVMEYYENGGLAQATLTYAQQVMPPACLAGASGWLAEYFNNMTLSGTPTNCRDDATINFDWGTGSPMSGVPVDRFSVRWTRTMNFAAGDYLFTMGSDDGGRLYVDGTLVLDVWFDQAYPASPPSTLQHLTGGSHTVVMEYYENGGYARATLTYAQQVTPPACTTPAVGWLGQYYSTVDLSGVPATCRDDAAINFDWGSGPPAGGMPSDNFSVRWTRTANFTAGTHRFTMGSDDGSRLYIDGALVFDRWWDQSYPSPPPWVDVTLAAGAHTVVMEFYERGGAARATLVWT
ncbi:MAG TPA: PA14 domain-containing protein, partial [Ilumatobacteraceae bacterium]